MAQPFGSGGNVDVCDLSVGDLRGFKYFHQGLKPVIRDFRHAYVGLGLRGEGRDLRRASGDGVEYGGLAASGKTYDGNVHDVRLVLAMMI